MSDTTTHIETHKVWTRPRTINLGIAKTSLAIGWWEAVRVTDMTIGIDCTPISIIYRGDSARSLTRQHALKRLAAAEEKP